MKLVGTRNTHDRATFVEAAGGATPAHGGLFVPAEWPAFADIDALLLLDWPARCTEILSRLLEGEFDRREITSIVDHALDFRAPVVRVADATFALELHHGPTLAFKDFGARFLAAVLTRAPQRGRRTILTATSGDTGAAVAHAFWQRPDTRVVVLYPHGRISALQERQIATLGDNVTALAVDGSFDDCQALVKACFADRRLSAEFGLASANSINIARLLAQVLYYFEGIAALRMAGIIDAPVIAVPSGNFGNLCAGLMAWKLGLPATAFVAATNVNDTVPRYLAGGEYEPRASVATISNAMDVGAPSNWERIEALFDGDVAALRAALRWGRATEDETRGEIVALARLGYTACPHTAVAHRVLAKTLQAGEVGMFLATAHPAKFGDVLLPILEREPELPPALAALGGRALLTERIPNDRAALVERIRRAVSSGAQ